MEGIHQQEPPRLGNQYTDDTFLRQQVARLVPKEFLPTVHADLERFGWRVATDVKELGKQAEAEPPTLTKFDAWGHRIDKVWTSEGWRGQKTVAADEGIVAIAYERRQAASSRVVQAAKLYLYSASSGLFSCPLAMTDGATRVCELLRSKHAELGTAYEHLTSRDPSTFWTSGQWMTEKAGGSDVASGTQTIACPEQTNTSTAGNWFHLTGYKWFTSAADGEMAMALARELDVEGKPIPGNKGLSLFYVPVQRESELGTPQGFEVVRLKDKLGTKQLPTAELILSGMRALKVSDLGRAVPAIATMISITRYYNAASSVSFMRRITALAQDYARRRKVFGRLLCEQPLALRTLAWLTQHTEASLALTLEVARLLGRTETGVATEVDRALLRVLTPLAKLFTAKEAVAVASEGLEFFGGLGYIESSGLPQILRDAQVLPIWEGTTNVLCLDLLRALAGDSSVGETVSSQGVLRADAAAAKCANKNATTTVQQAATAELVTRAARTTSAALRCAGNLMESVIKSGPGAPEAQVQARDLAMVLANAFSCVLLIEHAAFTGTARDALAASEWARTELMFPEEENPNRQAQLHPAGFGLPQNNNDAVITGNSLVLNQEPRGGSALHLLKAARILARVDESLSSPRALF